MSTENKQVEQFTVKLLAAIGDAINNEDSDFHIDAEDISEHTTDFFHALFNCVPAIIYQSLSGDDKNTLQCNHLANQLIYQYKSK